MQLIDDLLSRVKAVWTINVQTGAARLAKPIPAFAFGFAAYAFSVHQQKIKLKEPLTMPQIALARLGKPPERIDRDEDGLQISCESSLSMDYIE